MKPRRIKALCATSIPTACERLEDRSLLSAQIIPESQSTSSIPFVEASLTTSAEVGGDTAPAKAFPEAMLAKRSKRSAWRSAPLIAARNTVNNHPQPEKVLCSANASSRISDPLLACDLQKRTVEVESGSVPHAPLAT